MNLPLGPDNIHEFLSAFADGELDPAQNLAVLDYLEKHLEALDYLRDRQHLRFSAQRIAKADEQRYVMPDTLKAKLNALVDADGPTPRPRRWWPRGLALVAAGLAIGAAASLYWRAPQPPATPPIARTSTQEDIDRRDAAIPVSIVRAATGIHVDCSRVAERLHAGGYPVELGELSTLVRADVNTPSAAPDLSSIGYHFVGAGPCAKPLEGTVHLLYKKDGPEPRATISVFAQRNTGQFGLETGRMYCIASYEATFPMCAWRTDQVVYFLIADDVPTAVAARQAIPSAPTRVGT